MTSIRWKCGFLAGGSRPVREKDEHGGMSVLDMTGIVNLAARKGGRMEGLRGLVS